MRRGICAIAQARTRDRDLSSPMWARSGQQTQLRERLPGSPRMPLEQEMWREALRRRDYGEETLAEIGRSYNVSGWTIARLE
jgi:hypothetical protein